MTDDPLAGLRIPSLRDLCEKAVGRMGIATIDLTNPLQRARLIGYLEQGLGIALNYELERALEAATSRAVTHVFRVMRDAEYQEKRRKYREGRAKKRAEERSRKKAAEREARMDYSRRNLEVSKGTVQ
jgi:hypothetical protein